MAGTPLGSSWAQASTTSWRGGVGRGGEAASGAGGASHEEHPASGGMAMRSAKAAACSGVRAVESCGAMHHAPGTTPTPR